MSASEEVTVYELVGGSPFFEGLVERFYAGVATDALLRPLYPDRDLAGARARLTGFLVQYWGGPDDYSRERGHPRLRMRHAPFVIGEAEREAWMRHMVAAVDAAGLDAELRSRFVDYFEMTAAHMVNVVG